MTDENALTGSETPDTPDQAAEVSTETEAKVETEDAPEAKAPEGDEAKQEADTKSDGDDEDAKSEKPKPKSRARERIEQVTRDNRNLRRTIARLNQQIGKLKAEKPLREEDFSDPAEYQAAAFKRAAKESALESQFENASTEMEELATKRQEAWADVVAEARNEIPDFEAVFNANVPVSEAMADLIMDSDAPAQVAYWLGKNISEARRIADMSPVEAARAIGRLEQRLTAPKPKTVSSAPKPVETVGGKAHKAGKTPEEMGYDDYKAWRMKQMAGG